MNVWPIDHFTVHVPNDHESATSGSTKWLRNIFQKAYRCNYDCFCFLLFFFFLAHTCKCKRNTSTKLKLFHYWSEQAMMAMMIHIDMGARHRYIGHTIQTKNVQWVEIVGQIHSLECFSKMYFLNRSVTLSNTFMFIRHFILFFERGRDTCNLIIIFNM